ncbi:tripartite tricarboxylate transporter TctB family protein [Salibacterium halotolerans]|uniref:Tripartite tricarboxylate transporter TctB family protein n=1 Tax=Salibacterium halotolerans TaxID=1884432 RepID=A0A1I5PBJ8_9BACI|nr:tripartite tricarboxylate transporter TctB family protein [Salibacterium halotolerans]SFP31498.1 Tripartite tricarboxylate transporter TctB family protein [Salibacterium halotolerans]
MRSYNFIFSGIIIILALTFYFWGNAFSADAGQWPQFFAITMLLLSVLLIVDTVIHPDREKETDEENKEIKPRIYDHKVFASVALLILYIFIMERIGFLLTTPFFLALLLWFIQYRQKGKLIAVSVGTTIGITVVFQFLLGVPIPQGLLENWF